ncbi:hypothetical protein ACS0TY_030381 [Phlomoides rotata]
MPQLNSSRGNPISNNLLVSSSVFSIGVLHHPAQIAFLIACVGDFQSRSFLDIIQFPEHILEVFLTQTPLTADTDFLCGSEKRFSLCCPVTPMNVTYIRNEKYSMPKGWKFEGLNGAESDLKGYKVRRAEVLAHAAKRILRQIRAHLTRIDI